MRIRRLGPGVLIALTAVGCLESHTRLEQARPPRVEMRERAKMSSIAPDSSFALERLKMIGKLDDRPRVKLMGQVAATQPAATQPEDQMDIYLDLPDPVDAPEVFDARLETMPPGSSVRLDHEWIHPTAVKYIGEIARPKQARLSLADCIHRTLASNYSIRIEGFGPAISTAQIVQAEAAFDAAFFATINRDNRDTPSASQLQSGESHTNLYSAGIRQRLASGAQVTVTQVLNRGDFPGFQFSTLNPSYTSNLIAELRQPFLRNFGVDFNRSQIDIAKNARDISTERFRRIVITSLNDAERAYWTLVGARRRIVITAELLAQAERTFEQVKARADYDAYATLIANARAQVFSRRSEYLGVKRDMFTAEDQLRNLMNDPELNLASEIEIIPTDLPVLAPIVRDQFREVEQAIDQRPEIREAQLGVENARINMGIAKNQALPTLDVVFRYTMNGLGGNADHAFDQETSNNFTDTFLALEFAWNFGERGERAGIRIASAQHSQLIQAFKQAVDAVITDIRVSFRNMETSFDQINPSSIAVDAAKENLRSIQEREERRSPEQLNTVLGAQSQLASTRTALLQAIVLYNQSITEVERAKGTLLEYDNVVLSERP